LQNDAASMPEASRIGEGIDARVAVRRRGRRRAAAEQLLPAIHTSSIAARDESSVRDRPLCRLDRAAARQQGNPAGHGAGELRASDGVLGDFFQHERGPGGRRLQSYGGRMGLHQSPDHYHSRHGSNSSHGDGANVASAAGKFRISRAGGDTRGMVRAFRHRSLPPRIRLPRATDRARVAKIHRANGSAGAARSLTLRNARSARPEASFETLAALAPQRGPPSPSRRALAIEYVMAASLFTRPPEAEDRIKRRN